MLDDCKDVENRIKGIIKTAVKEIYHLDIDVDLKKSEFCDYCSIISFIIAKNLKKNPNNISTELVEYINNAQKSL